MPVMFIFGLGYTASHLARSLRLLGWEVLSTGAAGTMAFDDASSVRLGLSSATHILSSIPPAADGDPMLNAYGDLLAQRRDLWLGYLSSTGVYGDSSGAWVDESAPVKGRRGGRNAADAAWLERDARVFRLPGIYGPGRSMLDRVQAGRAHRIDLPDQVFSRVHVDDIVAGILAARDAPPGAYNLADDHPCSQNEVVAYACDLIGIAPPPVQTMDAADLSPMARAFYAENRRVANGKAKRILNWRPRYPDYRAGLSACLAAGE